MPESSTVKDVLVSSVECRTSPLWRFSLTSLHRNSLSTFCSEDNVQECLSHISQEVASFGLPPVWTESGGCSELNIVAVLNCMHDLIQLHRQGLRTLENMEVAQLKSNSNVDFLQLSTTRLKGVLGLQRPRPTALRQNWLRGTS